MKFEYNANLILEERAELVAKEILEKYPLISYDDAYFAAMHLMPIDDKITNADKFDRYYFILRTIGRNNAEFLNVLTDAYNLYREGFENKNYNNIIEEIIGYALSGVTSFPELVSY